MPRGKWKIERIGWLIGLILLVGLGSIAQSQSITSATYDVGTGNLVVTGSDFVANSGDDVDASTFTITGEGGNTYTLTDTLDVEITSATEFTLTLSSTDKLNVHGLLNKNGTQSDGGTTYNLAGATNWLTAGATADTTGNGITVSNVATPTITSATYDVSTGSLVVTGTNLVKKSGATNDIDASKLTVTGEGSGTYTLTDTPDVEITSATQFTLNLSTTDKTGIYARLNKNGTQSNDSTIYNLAAADNWLTGAAPSVDISDTTSNGITVSGVSPPTVTDGNISISGATGTGSAFKVGDTVTATWNNTASGDNNSFPMTGVTVNFSAFGGGSAVAASDSPNSWTATYTIASGSVDGTNLNVSVTATDNAGNTTTTADTTNATVDNQPPTVTDANISISGATGTGGAFKVGDTVTATWNNTAGGDNNSDISSVTVNFSAFGGGSAVAASDSPNTWTATFSVVDNGPDGSNLNVSVTATDDAGNTTMASDTTNATLDSNNPDPVITGPTSLTKDDPFDITIAFGEAVTGFAESDITVGNGSVVTGSLVNTSTGNYSASIDATTDGTVTVDIAGSVVQDTAGNNNNVATQLSLTVDTTPPTLTSIVRALSTATTNASTLTFMVTFNESVTGVDTSDFQMVQTGTAVGSITGVSGSNTTYTVSVSVTQGHGTLGIALVATPSIQDTAGNLLVNTTPTGSSEVYTVKVATWTGAGGDDNWSNTANWDSGVVPVAGDKVVIASAGPVVMDVATLAIDSLDVSVSLTLNNTLTVETLNILGGAFDLNGQTANVSDDVTVSTGAVLKDDGVNGTLNFTGLTATASLGGGGTINLDNLTIDGNSQIVELVGTISIANNLTLTNGALVIDGATTVGGNVSVTGDLTIKRDATLNVTGTITVTGNLTNYGSLSGTGGVNVTQDFTNNIPMTLTNDLDVDGTFTNNDTLTVTGVRTIQAQKFVNSTDNTLVVTGTLTLTTTSFTNNLRAQVHVNGGGTLRFAEAVVNVPIKLNNAGIINLGASVGPGSAGDGTLRPVASTDDVQLLNTGVINMGTANNTGQLGITGFPIASLDNVGLAPVTGTGTINIATTTGAPDNDIYVKGDWKSAGTFIPGDSNVVLSGTGTLIHSSIDGFNELDIMGGTRTLGSAITVTASTVDAIDIDAGATFAAGSYDITASDTVDVDGIMTATGGTQTFPNLAISGRYDNGTSNVTLKVSGTISTAVNSTAVLGSGEVRADTVTIVAGSQFTSTSGELYVATSFSGPPGGVFNHNNGTLVFTDGGTFPTGGSSIIYSSVTKTGLGTSTTLTADLTMVGDLTVESGTLAANSFDIDVAGNVSVMGNSIVFTTGDLNLNPAAGTTKTFNPGPVTSTYNDVTKRGRGTTQLITNALVLTTSGPDVADLVIEEGTFEMGSQNVTVPNALTIQSTATLKDDTGKLTVLGATTIDGTLSTSGAGKHEFDALTVAVGGVYDNGTSGVTVSATGAVQNSGTTTLGSGPVNFTTGLTNSGVLNATSGTLYVTGNLTNTGTVDPKGGTIVFGGTSTFTPGTSVYHAITKDGSGTTTTLAGSLTTTGTLTADAGVFDIDSYTVQVPTLVINTEGELRGTSTGLLDVAGDLTNNGRFSHLGTLKLSGTGTLTPGSHKYPNTLVTSGIVSLAANSVFDFAGLTWTNTGTWTSSAGSTVRFVRSGAANPQTLITGGAPNVPVMSFVNVETDNDGTITMKGGFDLSGTFTIAGGATVRNDSPGSVHNFTNAAEVNVSGTWLLTGSDASHIRLLGPVTPDVSPADGVPDDDQNERWTLTLNSNGVISINYVDLLSSELVTHGGSLNGTNVGYKVQSFGNLSESWKPFDPVPVPIPADLIPTVSPGDETVQRFPGDANDDGWVNLSDFSILAAVFGSDDARADFNTDGIVNLADFSILAVNFGKSADGLAAPAAHAAHGTWLMADGSFSGDLFEVRLTTNPQTHKRANAQTERSDLRAYAFQLDYDHDALELLEVTEGDALPDTLFVRREDGHVFSASRTGAGTGVLATLRFRVTGTPTVTLRDVQVVDAQGNLLHLPDVSVNLQPSTFNLQPERTRLLSNYPNPFNPETWIPFELASGAAVRLDIFDVPGRLVRTLELGRLSAGRYVDSSSAAHWDGKNNAGERVASGTYYYRLTAGEFTAIRRMVILK